MLIALIGYRGAGKTTVAKLVARRLGWHFVDSDADIARVADISIKEIFSVEGEDGFRRRETIMLTRLLRKNKIVLALGGGVVTKQENRSQLHQAAIRGNCEVIWLRAPYGTLWARIQSDDMTPFTRPNLTGFGGVEEVQQMVDEREPLYQECASFSVNTENKTIEDVTEEIVMWFKRKHPD